MHRFYFLLSLSLLPACGASSDEVRLDWSEGETFHVAARYQHVGNKTEESPASLEGDRATSFADLWSDEVVWSYQVVETGLVPHENDELFPYARTADGGVAAISVVRAWADASLNDDEELLAADPVVYMVFHEDTDRLAAIVQFLDVDGERVEKAWTSSRADRDWGALSQSMFTMVPTYLAPRGARYASEDVRLGNGGTLTTEDAGGGVVDTYYDDEIGGGLVLTRYERGQPWPTFTAADNVEARLLGDDDVAARRAARPYLPDPPEDYDFRAALQSSVDVEAALTLDADTIDGGWEASTPDAYQPWAGSWWKQSEGALIFGYDGRDTLSDRIKSDVDPLKKELDGLSEELRSLTEGSEAYDEKVRLYQEKQEALVTKLVDFYGGVLQDLDGGRLKIEGGKLVHTDGWSYDLDELSPMDKFALQLYVQGDTYPNPFYGPAWEILNHYSPAGGSWWGHCNGWAAAAILTHEPRTSKTVDLGDARITYTAADQKGLLSESHYSTYSSFYGARYNGESDDISDLSPKAFHVIVTHYVRDRQVPIVFDTSANEQVWNYPAYAADVDVEEKTAADAASGERTFDVTARVKFTTDGVPETHIDGDAPQGFTNTYRYELVTDADGLVLRGTWADDKEHPDFAWIPYENPVGRASGGSENPYLPYGEMLDVLGSDLRRE